MLVSHLLAICVLPAVLDPLKLSLFVWEVCELDNIQTVVREIQGAVLTWVVAQFPIKAASLSEFMNSDTTLLLT